MSVLTNLSQAATIRVSAPDLTRRAPRSLRCRLGGYAILPRLLDKCRAAIAGTIGEYHTNCPLDQQFLVFAGIDYNELKAELAAGKTDGEILAWISARAKTPRLPWEIAAWSDYQERRLPASDAGTAGFFSATLGKMSSSRPDINSWADLLDLDDHVSFGGAA